MPAITPHTTGHGFEIQFKNGCLDIPDRQGAYLLSTGCGAGKTQSIRELIQYKQDEGILYCVDTKAEVDKMYNFLKNSDIVADSDILRLHGDATTELDAYRDHPEDIMQKKVILLTHVRFWSDLSIPLVSFRQVGFFVSKALLGKAMHTLPRTLKKKKTTAHFCTVRQTKHIVYLGSILKAFIPSFLAETQFAYSDRSVAFAVFFIPRLS